MRLSSIFGSLGDCMFLCGDSDGVRRNVEDAENGRRGERSRRRDVSTFLREPLGLAAFSAGSTLGAARPQTCAKEPLALWTLLALRRGRVSAYTRRRHPGTRKDLTGSDLWPVRSGCIAIISTRTIGDLPDSDLWSGRSCITARQQVEAGTAGRPQAARSRVACAKRCGSRTAASLDSLLLIRGRVPLAKHRNNCYPRIIASAPRSTRVHGKT